MNDTNTESIQKSCENTMKTKISGIYKIVNKINRKYYVGSSNDVVGKYGRFYEHKNKLIKNKHINKHLQYAWNKYGKENFEFILIETTDINKMFEVEQKYLDIAKNERNKCYNKNFLVSGGVIYDVHPMLGKKHSVESNLKNSESNKIAQKGEKNARYDKSVYTFYNRVTNQIFSGTRYQFYTKFNLSDSNIGKLIKNKKGMKSVKNWALTPNGKIGHSKGKDHWCADKTIYRFYNIFTNERFEGMRFELCEKYNLNPSKISLMCHYLRNHHKGWKIE